MKKWLSGVMMFMLCVIATSKVVYADVVVGPDWTQGPGGLLRGLAILIVIVAIVVITWKIIQNIKKRK